MIQLTSKLLKESLQDSVNMCNYKHIYIYLLNIIEEHIVKHTNTICYDM